jgi:nicotinamidase-related amidase
MRRITVTVILCTAALLSAQTGAHTANINLRSRVQPFKGSPDWQEVRFERPIDFQHTALVLCDMWDHHWCKGAESRVGPLAVKIEPVIEQLRAHGVLIIHAPSETMQFYTEHPARLAMLKIPQVTLPHELDLSAPPLPIDDSDGGCDTGEVAHMPESRVWTRENATIHIAPGDLVSDKGQEVYSALCQRGIHDLLLAGVHTNMCVLNRGFAIKQMSKWGVRCILIRDLTDAMYNSKRPPNVSHAQGTELVIEHIEKYWAPTTTSRDLLSALK